MSHFFIFLFNFFKGNRPAFAAFLIITIAFIGFFAPQISLEEDISKIIPRNEKVDKLNFIFQNSRFADKLIVNISLTDEAEEANPEKLIDFAARLSDSLRNGSISEYIASVTDQVPENLMFEVYNFLYDNLPIFLTEEDYSRIDEMISPASIRNTMENNYKILISPAGMVLKSALVRDPLGITNIPLKRIESFQFDDNFELYNGYIITKNKKNLLMFIQSENSSKETAVNTIMLAELDSLIRHVSRTGGSVVNAEYFGGVAVAVGNALRIKKDVQLTVSVAVIVLLLFISWFFRKKSIFFIIVLPVFIGGGIAVASLFLIKSTVSAIALGVGSVLLGITIDYSLHIVTHFRHTNSIRVMLKDVSEPILMSCLTTASAFLCLMLVSSEALQDLGLFAALSVVSAALFSLIVLPHFLKENSKTPDQRNIVDAIAALQLHKSVFMIGLVLVISVLCLFSYDKVEFETDMMKMNYMSDELALAEKNLNKVTSASAKSIFLVSSGETIQEALENNEQIISTVEELKNKELILAYTSVGTLMISEKLQLERIARWNAYWTASKSDSLKKHLIAASKPFHFKESAFSSFYTLLARGRTPLNANEFKAVGDIFLNDYITESEQQSTIVTLIKASRDNKDEIISTLSGFDGSVIFDREYLTLEFVKILKKDFNLLVTISLLLVFIILVLSYGRIELGIITFLPILISWLWTLGIMGAIGIKFNIFNIIISTFIFGLGIDYSIFIMRGLLQEYKYGRENLSSYKTSIFLSVFTTITGLGVLIFAQHPALRSIALLSIIGILSVVIIAYTIEPLMFRWLVYVNGKKRTTPITLYGFIYAQYGYGYFFIVSAVVLITGLTGFRLLPVNIRKRLLHWLLAMVTKTTIYVMFMAKKVIINPNKENFSKPAIIIANHQSVIDIPLVMMFSPKTIVLTHDWVWNNFLIGALVKQVDFYPASMGIDKLAEKLEKKVKEGYSIIIFPEGTRAEDLKIKRFHKGAFYLAEKLNLDILPMIIHGTGHYVTKGEYYGNKSTITVKFLDRIKLTDTKFGTTPRERAKLIGAHFRKEFEVVVESYQYPAYYRERLLNNYIYKGPVLEWYTRIKTALEDNYKMFHELIPLEAKIVDIGCGYGYLPYMLNFLSVKRDILGIDYDKDKIDLANNCMSKNQNVNFVAGDVTDYKFKNSDVFVLNDVLHYLKKADQDMLITKCIDKLNRGGKLIIRDGDRDLQKRHLGTRLSEFYSTNFGFNKTKNELEFVSGTELLAFLEAKNMNVEVIDTTKLTSNLVYVVTHKHNGEQEQING